MYESALGNIRNLSPNSDFKIFVNVEILIKVTSVYNLRSTTSFIIDNHR
jgi:hypothetical protein